jgi:hypothetical protein
MDTQAARELLAAVIETAVWDRRLAVTRNLVDEQAKPVFNPECKMRNDKWGVTSGLHYFFKRGGLETVIEWGSFNLDVKRIKERSEELL